MNKFLNGKGVGFYVSASSVILSFITLILYVVYGTAGGGRQYFSVAALVLLIISITAFWVLCVFRQTQAWAPLVQSGLLFVSFLVYISACYRYFTEVFYGGVNANAFAIMNKWFFVSLIFFFVSMVVSQVGVHMSQSCKKLSVEIESAEQSEQTVAQ